MKSYVVIGMGRFGSEVARQLYKCGCEVLAVDLQSDLIQQVSQDVTHAVVADSRDREVLKMLGVGDFDCAVVGIGDDLAAVCINHIVPAVLVVGGVAAEAVNFAVGTFGDGLGGLVHILVSPVVIGISNAVLVEDGLVVQQGNGIMVLGQGIDSAIVAGVQVHDAFVVVLGVGGCIGSDVVIQLQQNVVFHVHLDGIGMHPEHVGHFAAGSTCLQQSPVVVPVHNFDGDLFR